MTDTDPFAWPVDTSKFPANLPSTWHYVANAWDMVHAGLIEPQPLYSPLWTSYWVVTSYTEMVHGPVAEKEARQHCRELNESVLNETKETA